MLSKKNQASDCSLECTNTTKYIYFGTPVVKISCLKNTILEKTFLYNFLIKTTLCTTQKLIETPVCPTTSGYKRCSTQTCNVPKTSCFADTTFKVVGATIKINFIRRYTKIDYAILILNSEKICVLGYLQDCSKCIKIDPGVFSMMKSCRQYEYICSRDVVLVTRRLKTKTNYMVLLIGLRPDNTSAGLVKIGNVTTECLIKDLMNVEVIPSYQTILVSWQQDTISKGIDNCLINEVSVKYTNFAKTINITMYPSGPPLLIKSLPKCVFFKVRIYTNKNLKETTKTVFTSSNNFKKLELLIHDEDPDNISLVLIGVKDHVCTQFSIIIEAYNTYNYSSDYYKSNTNIINNVRLKRNVLYLFYITFISTKTKKPISPDFYLRKYYSSQTRPILFTYGPILEDSKLVKFQWAIFRKFEGSIFIFVVQFWSESVCKGAHLLKCENCRCYTSIYNLFPTTIVTLKNMLKCDWINVSKFDMNEVQFDSYIKINESEGFSNKKHYLVLFGVTPAGFIRMSESNQLTITNTEGFSLEILATLFIIVVFIMSIMIILYFFLKKKRRAIRSEANQVIQRHKNQSDDDSETRSNAKPSSSEQ